ncbi:putative glutathione S-transferase [Tieghemostelium lacteum]|uniref:Putative glutathione S-transferase n=1 Tax=Tieghemostelium lacteum TaxID=361077 RepID=A0A152A1P4_TIELA|nr:putative glutathione S-transferase [Tieghemostelium lacteum]|eukprot:KYQ99990.1 putative glutathione S-transferase [Tieghemostelium lacteum]
MEPIENKLNLYSNNAPSPHSVHILLDALGIDFQYNKVNVWAGENKTDVYKRINPNGKIPAIIDKRDGKSITIFESGAILQYLGETSGRYLPDRVSRPNDHWETIEWLFWHNSSFAPFLSEFCTNHYFVPKQIPEAQERLLTVVQRVFNVLNDHLATRQFVAANELTIADFALFTWLIYLRFGFLPNYKEYTNIVRYFESLEKIPSFKKEIDVILSLNFNGNKPKF